MRSGGLELRATPPLLAAHPLIRSRSAEDASERMGRVFSPHRLEVRGPRARLDVCHNQLRLHDLSLNVLSYGTEVLIDPGERGDFYLIQLPLRGAARLACGGEEAEVDPGMLSILQPHVPSRMLWNGSCQMLLLQVSREALQRRLAGPDTKAAPRFALTRPRHDPDVAAWWQAVLDLTGNLDRHGDRWLRHPAAYAAMEEFLLCGFKAMLYEPLAAADSLRGDERCLRRAKEFIHAHPDRALRLDEIADHACVSGRTLEAIFRRHGESSPLAYARRVRLEAVHRMLVDARRAGRTLNVTDVALEHGFVHMGRFATQYRQRFGCTPSHTLHAS
ncbi:MAG: hypothetical protein BGO72_02700 [Burkholderiales bacterium 70-64]|nr:MAG: hypothetical protein BGO72_02700 [Burkholderiales bacterium 70-64]